MVTGLFSVHVVFEIVAYLCAFPTAFFFSEIENICRVIAYTRIMWIHFVHAFMGKHPRARGKDNRLQPLIKIKTGNSNIGSTISQQ